MTEVNTQINALEANADATTSDGAMSRRALLGRSAALGGTLAAGSLLTPGSALARPRRKPRPGRELDRAPIQLTSGNPLATAQQREVEALAISIMQTPAVQAAMKTVAGRWKLMVGPANITPEAQSLFNAFITEYVFHYTLMAVVGDPNYPKIVRSIYAPPHRWFGMNVLGSRSGGGDNADNDYTMIPVQHGNRYEIHGRRFASGPADIPLVVIGNPSTSMIIGSYDIVNGINIGRDGRYTLTVGPEPSSDPNHIQTAPGAMYLFIRFSRSDWRQLPDALAVRRLGRPTAPKWNTAQITARAVSLMSEDVPPELFFTRSVLAGAGTPNTVSPPASSGGTGGLPAQSTSFAQLNLTNDQAFIVTVGTGGAAYHSLQLYDFWFTSLDYWEAQTTLNNAQSAPNPDGTITYVVSKHDPGVANWLDTTGLQYLIMVHRWQRVPSPPGPAGSPSISGKLVNFTDVATNLPAGVPTVTPAQRRQQLADRSGTFALRYRAS
jgi:hypothetical protein